MKRDEFYAKASALDEDALRKALWTLYWRGTAPVRERIEDQLDPQQAVRKQKQAVEPPDPTTVLMDVESFEELARSGAYLVGDRRVSPKERSRWRFTFRDHAADAQAALQDDDVDTAAAAVALLIDLAAHSRDFHCFRSDDPMQAAGFVVSDAVGRLWSRLLDHHGFAGFAQRAAPQLIRWEAPYGWTRYGFGSVAEKETTLATVLDGILRIPDHWEGFAERYLEALDAAADSDKTAPKDPWGSRERIPLERARALEHWHRRLFDQLHDTEATGLLDRLVTHPALGGPERTYLEAELAYRRGEVARARELIARCLDALPGHRGFLEAARLFAES